jgi:O-antigen ligase
VGVGILLLADSVSLLRKVVVLIGAAAVLLVAAPQGYWKQMQSITSPTEDYNWTAKDGRKQVAKRGLHYMLDYPVAGIGISNFPRAEGTISDKAREWTQSEAGIRWSAAHNSHIEAGAELGIPGLLLWISMLVGGVVGPLRLRRRLPKAWRHGAQDQRFLYAATSYLPISMLGFVVSSTFVSFAYLDPVYVLLAFVSGLYVCTDALLKKRSTTAAKLPRQLGQRAFSGAA